MKKILLSLLFVLSILSVLFLSPGIAKAQDLDITCDGSGTCIPSTSPALFPASEIWYPGKSLSKTVRIRNNSPSFQNIGTQAINTAQTGNLDQVMILSIRQSSTNNILWAGSLKNFYLAGEVNLATFSSSSFDDFVYTVSMEQPAGNEYQDKKTSFDLVLGFLGTTTTPAPTPTTAPDAGVVLGAGVSAPVCSDAKPGTPTGLTAAAAGAGSVLLTWTAPTPPYTYFLIAYSNDSTTMKWGNPNIGTATSYTVSGLGAGTYYFWVRAGNGCMPGDFTGPVSPGPIAGAFGVPPGGIAPGFAPGVLGVATPGAKLTATPSGILGVTKPGEIKGEEVVNFCQACLWWKILFGEIIVLFLYYYLVLKKYSEKIKKPLLVSSIIPIITYVVFLWLNKDCLTNYLLIQSQSFFCRYFCLLDLLMFGIVTYFWRRRKQPKSN